jgi:hypothetical protein
MRARLIVIIGIIIAALAAALVFNIKGKTLSLTRQEPQENAAGWPETLAEATRQEAIGNLREARSLYKRLVRDFANVPQVGDWQKKVWDLNINLLFSPAITPGSIFYEIKSGDSLAKIAKQFNTTIELLQRSNGLSGDKIIAGKRLKVWIQFFNIVIDKSQNILILKSDDDEVIKIYTVSTGINNSTPVGDFKIDKKLVNPTWFKAGAAVPPESPDNILGSRWMGFDLAGYGIHGTTQPESLGKQITQGCVRMSNSDIEELFAIVPVGTQVTIVD